MLFQDKIIFNAFQDNIAFQDKKTVNAIQYIKTVNAIQDLIPVQDKIPIPDMLPVQDKIPIPDMLPVQDKILIPDILPIQYMLPVQDKIPFPDMLPVQDKIPIPDKLPVQNNNKKYNKIKCIIIKNNKPTIYSIFHSILSFFAIYLSFNCNKGSFNFVDFFMALFFPYIYIIYKYANKRLCCVFK